MEMLFLVISVLILFSAVIYWLWSHIQNVNKKTALLEAAIFDLKGMVGAMLRGSEMEGGATVLSGSQDIRDVPDVPDVPEVPEVEDLNDVPDVPEVEDLNDVPYAPEVEVLNEVPYAPEVEDWTEAPPEAAPETSPVVAEAEPPSSSSASVVSSSPPSSLDSMGLKDLRRLAERRNVAGWDSLKKKELIQALKAQVSPVSEEETHVLE